MVGELEDAVVASTRICLERVKRATKKKKRETVNNDQTEIRTGPHPNATSLRSFNHCKISNVSLFVAK